MYEMKAYLLFLLSALLVFFPFAFLLRFATFLFLGLLCFEVPNSTLFANQP